MLCIPRLTRLMPIQQEKPINRGFPPVLISFTMSVLRPMAAMAIIIKNLLKVLAGAKNSSARPKCDAMVVMTDARMK